VGPNYEHVRAGPADEHAEPDLIIAADGATRPSEPAILRVGRPLSGRHREHVFPGRRRRIAPSFTTVEYELIVHAATRSGLTPTGFCAHAALYVASGGAALPASEVTAIGSSEQAPALDVVTGRPGGRQDEALAAFQAELAQTRTAVVRVGTNLNQAVAAFHATGQAPVWLARVVELCGRALASVDEVASRLHRLLP
jgi:hypothetical protein